MVILFVSAALLVGLAVTGRCVRSLADSVESLERQRASLEDRMRASGKPKAPE